MGLCRAHFIEKATKPPTARCEKGEPKHLEEQDPKGLALAGRENHHDAALALFVLFCQ